MKKIFFILFAFLIVASACTPQDEEKNEKKVINKIEVYHIHEVPECYSCMISGQYVEEVLNTSFSDELSSGKIEYKDIDKSDPENNEIVEKYGVNQGYSGIYIGIYSSIGFETKEYTAMWNLDNKEVFMQNFKNHIATILGGEK